MKITKFWKFYPKSKNKNLIKDKRKKVSNKTRIKLQKFGKDYFDGVRDHGYGGYYYDKKYFRKIAKSLVTHYKLNNSSNILDIGCAKGFLMFEFKRLLPKAKIMGIDVSRYCKIKAIKSVKKNIIIGTCSKLPFNENYFDFIVSISTIHNLNKFGVIKSLNELQRVKKINGSSFIRVKAYKTVKQKKFIDEWNVVAKSNLSEKEWIKLFKKTNYNGDYDFSKF
jgi:ubiquinone/menaquinone biosynthesis C-methylase UbiE